MRSIAFACDNIYASHDAQEAIFSYLASSLKYALF